jgi:hypothetical protein
MKSMIDIMKRCLSMGFPLSVIFAGGLRRHPVAQHSPQLSQAPAPLPLSAAPAELPPTSNFNGTVIRDGSRFALREPDGTLFALDSTGRAWPFEGEDVAITGYFNPESRLLHICAIEAVEDIRAEAV